MVSSIDLTVLADDQTREDVAWFEQAALAQAARNLWVCASSFNARAIGFYERHGFEAAAALPGLVAEGYEEIPLRKFPLQASG